MFVLIVIFLWALCGFAGAKIMDGKGRNSGIGATLGLLFGIFGIIVCLCFSKTLEKKAEELAYLRSIYKD